jgi:endonuclease YncB( thermonuclease family)
MFYSRFGAFGLTFGAGLLAGLACASTLTQGWPGGYARSPAKAAAGEATPLVKARAPLAGVYRAQILNVVDGDTVEARIHVWMGQEVVARVRLRDIDAPEIGGACGQERDRAVAARDRLSALLSGSSVTLADIGPDKYFGRVVARVLDAGGGDVGQALLSEGLARPYKGGRREAWCELAQRS